MKNKGILAALTFSLMLFISCSTNESLKVFPVKSGDKWGYVDTKGKYIINPQFDYAGCFREGLALTSKDGKFNFIDKSGRMVINKNYLYATDFSEGLACVVEEDKAPVFIDKKGDNKIVLSNEIEIATVFNEGLAAVCIKTDDNSYKWGYINKQGKFEINPQFVEATSFKEGLAAVRNEDEWGFINSKGNYEINPQFKRVGAFEGGLAAVYNSDNYGYINKKGEYVINPQFKYVSSFSGNLAAVSNGDEWGYIDKKGKYVINPQFDQAGAFRDGLALIRDGDDYGYIDKKGTIKINPQFDEAGNFISGLAFVSSGDKYGLIDAKGKYKINPQFSDISRDIYYFVEGSNYRYSVRSDFFELDAVVDGILMNTTNAKFAGISKNMPVNDVLSLFKIDKDAIRQNDYVSRVDIPNDQSDNYSVRGSIQFANYIWTPVRETVRRGYYTYNQTVGYTFNEDNLVSQVYYTVNLLGKSRGKSDRIYESLVQRIKNMGYVENGSQEEKRNSFRSDDITLETRQKGYDIVISAIFNREMVEEEVEQLSD